jgi:hypothetical protein
MDLHIKSLIKLYYFPEDTKKNNIPETIEDSIDKTIELWYAPNYDTQIFVCLLKGSHIGSALSKIITFEDFPILGKKSNYKLLQCRFSHCNEMYSLCIGVVGKNKNICEECKINTNPTSIDPTLTSNLHFKTNVNQFKFIYDSITTDNIKNINTIDIKNFNTDQFNISETISYTFYYKTINEAAAVYNSLICIIPYSHCFISQYRFCENKTISEHRVIGIDGKVV